MSEELKLPSGEEVEKELLKREQETALTLDSHATMCALWYPKLIQMMNTLNQKALRRVNIL